MKIRSITIFCNPGYPPRRLLLEHVGIFARHARSVFGNAGFEVQSCRLATPPFADVLPPFKQREAAQMLHIGAHAEGFGYLSLGPAQPDTLSNYDLIPEIIAKTDGVFMSGMLTTPRGEVSLAACQKCAEIIARLAGIGANGFANLRFAALANVPPFAPFFPAAYGEGSSVSFALALEAADLAQTAFAQAESLAQSRQNLIALVEENAAKLEEAARKLEKMYSYTFRGLDFTLAPFPEEASSIAVAIESLGLPSFGQHGSLFASAFLTDSLDQAHFTRTGFNGLMLPVLEDSGMAQRAAAGLLDTSKLLLFSAVCGTGLDVIPLPGDSSAEQLYPVLLDLAALALRLGKPLTARLMPIPGKQAGDETSFSFEYFANSRVMPLASSPLSGALAQSETITIHSRGPDWQGKIHTQAGSSQNTP